MRYAARTAVLVLALSATANAQTPGAPPSPAPGAGTTPPSPAPPPPPAAPRPSASPPSAPAPTPGAAASPAPAGASDTAAAPATPNQEEPPPPAYYVEPATSGRVFEPPTPGGGQNQIWEPPPPPEPRHVAPKTAFWIGARLGWFVPFGSAYARAVATRPLLIQEGVRMRDYLGPGPLVELDIGARFSRNYTLFALWERADLPAGDGDDGFLGEHGALEGGDTDFWAIALRASSDADYVGFASELALGYRRARAEWEDGTSLEMTDGIFEARVGLGADIRINRTFSLSPMVTFGVGMFGDVDLVGPDGGSRSVIGAVDDPDGHGWFTFHLGGHFDIAGKN